jgi:hypothetical protein
MQGFCHDSVEELAADDKTESNGAGSCNLNSLAATLACLCTMMLHYWIL